jgi:phosphatidylglycerophosphate synthase
VSLLILGAAALSDVLDGWWARRSRRETSTGAILDAVVDKVFVAAVAVTLLVEGRLTLFSTLLLGARDVVELPLVVWSALNRRILADGSERVKANMFGKAVTVVQFVTAIAALFSQGYVYFLALAAGALGVVAGATYWARVLRRGRTGGPDDPPQRPGAPSNTVLEPEGVR